MTSGERNINVGVRFVMFICIINFGVLLWLGFLLSHEVIAVRDNKIEALRSEASSVKAALARCEAKSDRKRK